MTHLVDLDIQGNHIYGEDKNKKLEEIPKGLEVIRGAKIFTEEE